MRTVAAKMQSIRAENLKTIARNMGEKLTNGKKRSWHLEMAISVSIFALGTMVLMASAQVI